MVYCEKEPYWQNAINYHSSHFNCYEVPFWLWMRNEYKTVLLGKDGCYSDNRPEHWAFNSEKDRDWFILRWS